MVAPLPIGRVLSVPVSIAAPTDARFMFLERIEYSSEHDDLESRSFRAMERRSGRKHTTWRDDQDRVAPVEVFAPVDIALHRPSGLVALAGFAGTGSHGNPEEFVGGEFLWILPVGQRQCVRVDLPRSSTGGFGKPWSIDIAPDGSRIAGMWWLGSEGAYCATVDPATCSLQVFTEVKRPNGGNLLGGGELRFSPDGRWLLLTSAIDEGLLLIEAASGQTSLVQRAGVTGATWWHQHSGCLLVSWLSGTSTMLASLDLEGGHLSELGLLELPAGMREDDRSPGGVRGIAVGPDGQSLVGSTAVAPDDAFGGPQRPRARIARGELFSQPVDGIAGRITEVAPAFIDRNGASALEQSHVRWLDVRPADRVNISSTLLEVL